MKKGTMYEFFVFLTLTLFVNTTQAYQQRKIIETMRSKAASPEHAESDRHIKDMVNFIQVSESEIKWVDVSEQSKKGIVIGEGTTPQVSDNSYDIEREKEGEQKEGEPTPFT